MVDGKPFLALAGELLNNSATSIEYLRPLWPKIVEARLNTVLAGVSWAQIEPAEGNFDFSVLDGVIRDARSHNLRLVLLWFGTWKNGLSSYPPDWVKKDFERFPRAQMVGDKTPWPVFGGPRTQVTGSLSIELFSPFGDATRDADARAFAAMMRHVKAVDGREHTVIGIQVENEVGIQGDTRDRSPAANKAYDGPVPKELMAYLQRHKDALIPELRRVWEAAGFKTSGTWEEAFGHGRATDEIFMAWNFARYVGRVVEAGKAEYPIPMFTNCPQEGFGKAPAPLHGGGQSGGPMPDAMDVWRSGAPAVDLFAADIYSPDFVGFCARYAQSGNPLFIAETGGGQDLKARALYAFGRHDAMSFSPFGIDRMVGNDPDAFGYDLLSRLAPLILEHQGKGEMSAVLLRPNDPPQKIQVGNYTLEAGAARRRGAPSAQAPQQAPSPVAMFIATGPDEYIAVGSGVTVTFSPNTPGPPLAGLATVEEGTFANGRWVPGRRLAGDDTEQGQYLDLRNMGIQRFTLYRYR
jgi:beta-galactosidase GanA